MLHTPKPSNSPMNDLDGPRAHDQAHGGTTVASTPTNAPQSPNSAPPDLLQFLQACPVREAVRLLGLAVGTVYRLRGGYWPDDPRRILEAWLRFKGRDGRRSTSWFLRRVRVGHVVHAGQRFGSRELAGRDGELIAMARTPDGGLIAVALDAPTARFVLARI